MAIPADQKIPIKESSLNRLLSERYRIQKAAAKANTAAPKRGDNPKK